MMTSARLLRTKIIIVRPMVKTLSPGLPFTYKDIFSGSTVKAATFFSVGKKKVSSRAEPRRILAAGSDTSGEDSDRVQQGRQATLVTASDEDSDDDVPLVSLGRQFLSESKFGKVATWVTKSPFEKKPRDEAVRTHKRRSDSSGEEPESLLQSDPEDGEVRPSWAAPLPPRPSKPSRNSHRDKPQGSGRSSGVQTDETSSNKTSSYLGDRSSKAPLSTEYSSSNKTSIYNGDRSSKAPLSTEYSSSNKTSIYNGDRSSKAPLSTEYSSSSKTSIYTGDSSSKAFTVSTVSTGTFGPTGERSSKEELSVGSKTSGNPNSSNEANTRSGENDSCRLRPPSHTSAGSSPDNREASGGVQRSKTQLDVTLEKLNHLEIEDNEEQLTNTEVQSSLLLPKARAKPLPAAIQNSVNAVRCWVAGGEDNTSVSPAVKHERCDSSSSDDFERFLSNLKTKKKVTEVVSSDENFIVPDDELDSDDSPKLSLRDRILQKSRQVISKPSRVKDRVEIPSSEEEEDGLPDIDSPVTRKITVRAEEVHVISSDGDSDGVKPFDNLYEPKNYNRIPAPAPENVTPKVKSVKKKRGEENMFKTPTPKATRTLTFLSSLTKDTPISRCHPDAVKYVKNFKSSKTELAERLYHMYNVQIFENALPDDMEITWNVRLTKTAGLCYSRRHKKFNIETRSCRIELSTKVIDSGDRLRDTLIHEMCHAASWIISGYRDGHGPLWRTWAEKAMRRFPELPVIDRCHSYQINTKYTYR